MKTIGIIQARTGSNRLPNKVLLPLGGRPMIIRMLERVSRCRTMDELWVATSTLPGDDPLAETVAKAGYQVFRGSETDVLERFYQLAKARGADIIVRLTGDCPLHDPSIIDSVVDAFTSANPPVLYASNCQPPTFPDGLDTEVFAFNTLERLAQSMAPGPDREHVTLGLFRGQGPNASVPILNVKGPADFSHLRWTLDYPEDYDLINLIFTGLHLEDATFGWMDVLAWLTKNPETILLNAGFIRNECLSKPSSIKTAQELES